MNSIVGMDMGLTPAGIAERVAKIEADFTAAVAVVAGLGAGDTPLTFDNTCGALAAADAEAASASAECTLPALVSTCKDTRDAAAKAKDTLGTMWVKAYSQPEVYRVVQQYSQSGDLSSLPVLHRRLVDRMLLMFERGGAQGDSGVADTLVELQGAASRMERNINEDVTTVALTKEELHGVADQFVDSLKRSDDGKYLVEMKAPHLMPVMMSASLGETRRRVSHCSGSRLVDTNTPVLADLVRLRHKLAGQLGFDCHADQMLRTKMAKTTDTVKSFLLDIIARVQPVAKGDLATLLDLKKQDLAERGMEPEDRLEEWDVAYYKRMLETKKYALDADRIKQYFPLPHVRHAIFTIYQEILSVEFSRVEAPVWHPDVEFFSVTDKETGELRGHFFIDLFSRDGKYGHQCVCPLRPSYQTQKGDVVTPVCTILGNMSKPVGDVPSLLRFQEVETFFHEFGHVMHCVLTRSPFSLFSWAWPIVPWPGGVEQDFLEVPSMMFQEWVHHPIILRRLSHHHETGDSLPDDDIQRLCDTKHLMIGLAFTRQCFLMLYDVLLHSSAGPYTYKDQDNLDLCLLFKAVKADVHCGFIPQDGTFMPATWYHMVQGYDVGYYGYVWSEVFAYDCFTRFLAADGGVLDSAVGRQFREAVLEPCATRDGADMLVDFLGRNPDAGAFFKQPCFQVVP